MFERGNIIRIRRDVQLYIPFTGKVIDRADGETLGIFLALEPGHGPNEYVLAIVRGRVIATHMCYISRTAHT